MLYVNEMCCLIHDILKSNKSIKRHLSLVCAYQKMLTNGEVQEGIVQLPLKIYGYLFTYDIRTTEFQKLVLGDNWNQLSTSSGWSPLSGEQFT